MKSREGLRAGLSIPILLLFAASTFAGVGAASDPQTVEYQEDFEDGEAQGWELEPGWAVRSDGGNQVLAGEGHQWARSNESSGDSRLSFRLKLIQGRIHLVYRYNDVGRYFIGFEAGRSDVSKQYWPDQVQNNIASKSARHSTGAWHQVEIVGRGGTLDFYVDGKREWTYTDPQPFLNGSFAFETLDASQAYVDDIVVSIGGESAASVGATVVAPPTASAAVPAPAGGSLTWVRTGGPLGGLGYDIRTRPDNPDVMYVTDAWAGVHKSTDGGATWFPSNKGITGRQGESGDAIPAFCLTIDPNNNDILWVGLQTLGEVYRSTNGGLSWEKRVTGIVEGEGLSFRGISIAPGDSNTVYAAGEISPWKWAGENRRGLAFDLTKGVLYKSTDAGLHWTAIWRGDDLARYILINPQDTNTLYLSTGIFDREAANSIPGSQTPGGVGVLKSTDGGQTWQQINTGLRNLYVGSLFMHPTDPNVLLAGAGNNAYLDGSGVYLTTDGGSNWQLVMDTGNMAVTSVEFSTSDPSIAYAGGQHVFAVSKDGGHTWSRREREEGRWGPPGISPGFPIDFQVDPRNPDRIFSNNYGGGNFLSIDGGATWESASAGYTGADLRSISVDPENAAIVYANGRSGPHMSLDAGSHWQGINAEGLGVIVEGSQISLDPSNPRHVLMTESNKIVIYWSEDGGRTWAVSSHDMGDIEPIGGSFYGGVEALAYAPSNPSRVYAVFGNNGCTGLGMACDQPQPASTVAVSNDGGRSWARITSTPHDTMPGTTIVVHPNNADRVWIGLPSWGVFATADGGATWQSASEGLGSAKVFSLALDATNPDILYAGTLDRGVYKSVDGGASWKAARNGMDPNEPVFSIVIDPLRTDIVYAGSIRSGVFRSENAGKSWVKMVDSLRTRSVHNLAISADGGTLYAATRGEGAFRLDVNGKPPEPAVLPTVVASPTQASPSTSESQPGAPTPAGRGPQFCGGAALPFALGAAILFWRRGRPQSWKD